MSESTTNPFTGTPYHSWDDVERDFKDHPECKAKIMAIWRRIQRLLTHQQIREFCGILGCANPGEMVERLNAMTDDELKAYVDRVKGKKKNQALLEGAVLQTVAAGVAQTDSKPEVQLTGEDGNVFNIIGRVSKALKSAGQPDRAKEFTSKALAAGSYDEVLRLTMEYCEVSQDLVTNYEAVSQSGKVFFHTDGSTQEFADSQRKAMEGIVRKWNRFAKSRGKERIVEIRPRRVQA